MIPGTAKDLNLSSEESIVTFDRAKKLESLEEPEQVIITDMLLAREAKDKSA